ncbi:hypothetical protein GCM10009867_17020 [Pedococcus aerophilus]|uniref:Uncharacterized protein n=2 Tax=Pedococcus aerophilus TaxID=436356 RepID=A0ABN3ULK1_9MICO
MTQPATPRGAHPLAPGPITALVDPRHMRTLVRTLRTTIGRHDDAAWVHPAPFGEREPIPTLSNDLLDATGVVGLRPPRTTGDSHLLRPLTHLIHGPVRHIVIDDASTLPTTALTELHELAVLAAAQLWLLIDVADRPSSRGTGLTRDAHAADVLDWATSTAHLTHPDDLARWWATRTPANPTCPPSPPRWWHTPLTEAAPLPTACDDHTEAGRVACLLAKLRRALTTGDATPTAARARLTDYTNHPDTTVTDRWHLTAAGRDLYTPGLDALRRTHPDAEDTTLADIPHDGSHITLRGHDIPVHQDHQPALARLRTSRHLAGCLPHEPVAGLFDELPGYPDTHPPGPRPRPLGPLPQLHPPAPS